MVWVGWGGGGGKAPKSQMLKKSGFANFTDHSEAEKFINITDFKKTVETKHLETDNILFAS